MVDPIFVIQKWVHNPHVINLSNNIPVLRYNMIYLLLFKTKIEQLFIVVKKRKKCTIPTMLSKTLIFLLQQRVQNPEKCCCRFHLSGIIPHSFFSHNMSVTSLHFLINLSPYLLN